jgi:aspartyl-tRNA(Asn)/glutamyl-tRNA(Gln) amidotransferase subunit A
MTEINWLSASELGAAYRSGDLSPVTVVEHLIARAEALDPSLNVFIHLDRDGARAQARQAETDLRAGRDLGPLHGIPCGIKDIIDVEGLRTTCHSRALIDNVAPRDAAVVASLRAAGAIILGKVATHEFAIGGPSFDLPFPPARNPWNRDHHPGGSSSGSGAGVAAGFFPLALGTDTGGSVRNPAGACGIMGLKPTYEMVPRDGVFPLSWSLDYVGPMARHVDDIALLLCGMTGGAFRPALDAPSVKGLRIGFVRAYHERDIRAGDDTIAALQDAADVLAGLGAIITDVELPRLQEAAAVSRSILTPEAWAIHGDRLRAHPEKYGSLSRRRLMVGAFVTSESYLKAKMMGEVLTAAVDDVLADVDLLLVANSMNPACRIDDEQAIIANYAQHARALFNITGHPALAMMCGLSDHGLPIGMQLVGPHNREDLVLQAGKAFELATDWSHARPEMAFAAPAPVTERI